MSTADASIARAALDDLLAIAGLNADDIAIQAEDLALDTRIRRRRCARRGRLYRFTLHRR